MTTQSEAGGWRTPLVSGRAVGELTEAELIARVQGRLPPPPDWMVVGIGDDAAIVEPERNRLEVLTVDALVEGVHFNRAFTPADAIGHRALAANLSDLAAMGARPRLALLSLALPPALPLDDFDGLVAGLALLAARHRVHVAGGNLARSPGPLVIDVTLVGTVKPRRALTRAGAQPGDELYVSGTIGAAAAGLQMLHAHAGPAHPSDTGVGVTGDRYGARTSGGGVRPHALFDDVCRQRYLYPEPRVRLGSLLGSNRAASACMDLSDGLADGVRQVAEASGVGARIDADALPIDPGARHWFHAHSADAVHEAIAGGDDYELLVAVRPSTRSRLEAARRHGNAPLTCIGVCTKDRAVTMQCGGGGAAIDLRPMPRGYTHFR